MTQRRQRASTSLAGLRSGVDLVAVADVEAAVERFGEAYLSRVFTEHEQASCSGAAPVRAAGLAARFAAKEAAIKVLEPAAGDPAPAWRDIEVRRRASGACELVLAGEAAYLAARAGIAQLAVGLSHEGGMACAVVVASLRRPKDRRPGSRRAAHRGTVGAS